MTGKVDFTNLLPEEEKKTVDISEVKDVSGTIEEVANEVPKDEN